MRHFLSILFGAAFAATASWSIGRAVFHRLRIELPREEHQILAGVTGAALLSLAVFALCALHVVSVPAMWVLGLLSVAAGLIWHEGKLTPMPGLTMPARLLFGVPFAFYSVFYLAHSVAPENSPDGSTYHLGLVYRYFREHGFERLTTSMYSSLSQGMEMLYLFAFSFGRQSAAPTLHLFCLVALACLMFCYGRRIERPMAGACAGMLVFLSPVAGVDATSAYNDVALALAAFAAFYLVEIWREREEHQLLIPIGLLAGFCFAIKYTGFTVILYVAIVMAWRAIQKRTIPWRAFVTFAGCAAILMLPWLVKNWLWLGNPLAPLFNRWFPNPFLHISFEDDYRQYLSHYELVSLRPLFWIVTVRGNLGGQLGPAFLLAPLALLALRKREGRRLLLAAAILLIPYPQNIGTRFLIPMLPFVAVALALALDFSRGLQATIVGIAAICAWPGVIDIYRAPGGTWDMGYPPMDVVLGSISQDKWFAAHSPAWVTGQMLDQFVPAGKRVWTTGTVAEAYSKSEILVNEYSAEGELIQDILTNALLPGRQPTRLYRFHFPAQMLRHLRIVQDRADPLAQWSIAEASLFHNGVPIPRANNWKFDAKPYPWDIALAFDGSTATRWNTWEPIRPGMYVDLDFNGPVTLDELDLLAPPGQPIGLHLDGIPARLEAVDTAIPANLRRLATDAVKARGIDYLMVVDDNWLASDMKNAPEEWNLSLVCIRGAAKLYRIQ